MKQSCSNLKLVLPCSRYIRIRNKRPICNMSLFRLSAYAAVRFYCLTACPGTFYMVQIVFNELSRSYRLAPSDKPAVSIAIAYILDISKPLVNKTIVSIIMIYIYIYETYVKTESPVVYTYI